MWAHERECVGLAASGARQARGHTNAAASTRVRSDAGRSHAASRWQLAAIAVPFHFAKQSQIIAMITIGVVFGPWQQWYKSMGLSVPTTNSLFDLGILFVLFMGGMEVDLNALRNYWQLVLVNGLGQILLNFGVFTGIGAAFFAADPEVSTVGLIYFGLCCTLSSTILVLGSLKKRGEMDTLQGQIILGLMVMQDVCAVMGIALMAAFDPTAGDVDVGFIVGYLMLWFAVLLICLYLLNRFVLDALFRFCAESSEMLFIGVYAYSLGIAAIFGHFLPSVNGSTFAQEIGVFFAGVGIAALDYRVQIETFVQPIKDFGVLLFFFMLGITLPSDFAVLKAALVPGVLIALLTVFVCPALLWLTGAVSGLDSRTSFLLGNTVNQISEFSLILANGLVGLKIFTPTMYITIVVATLVTFVLSSMGHVYADDVYERFFRHLLACLDRWCRVKQDKVADFVMTKHVVLLGFNAIALEIAEYYRGIGRDVLVIQLDPKLHHDLQDAYQKRPVVTAQADAAGGEGLTEHGSEEGQVNENLKRVSFRPQESAHGEGGRTRNAATGEAVVNGAQFGGGKSFDEWRRSWEDDGCGTNIYSQYADPTNPDTWHHYNLHHASMVVSCETNTTESDCILAHELKHHEVPFLCVTNSNAQARVLYDAGVTFVIQPDAMAAHTFQRHLYDAKLSKCSFLQVPGRVGGISTCVRPVWKAATTRPTLCVCARVYACLCLSVW